MPGSRPIGDILTGLAAQAPELPAITCDDRTITRGELESRANRLARAYAQHGVTQGDFVTITLPNSIEFFEACYAIWKLGAIPQPASSRLPDSELQRLLTLANPALTVGIPPEKVANRASVPAGFKPDSTLKDTPLPARTSPAWKAPTSGGSTGQPKLIVAGRAGALDPDAMLLPFRLRRGQVQLTPGPLYHNSPFTTAMGGTFLGQHVVILPRFDARAALDAIAHHAVNFVNLVPTMMLRMLREIEANPDRFDLSTLDTVFHTAAPCPPWLKRRWIDLVGPERVYEVFGGTEGQAFTAISGEEWLGHRGSVGRPVGGEIGILGPDGTPAAPGVVGVVGEVIMRRPPGSRAAYRYIGAEARVYDGGWESLGDRGWFDADGYLYLADRDSDLVVTGGANVYPAEVESAIMEHPGVLSCAVVGLPDEDLGQRPHAVVQVDPAPGEDVTEASLREFVAQRLARYKVPRSFRLVDTPLRDEAGKLRRGAVLAAEIEVLGTDGKGTRQ